MNFNPHSCLILFSCLSYFFLFFCLGILSTPAKEKKLITEKSYMLRWQIAQGALSALIRLCWGATACCSLRHPAGS